MRPGRSAERDFVVAFLLGLAIGFLGGVGVAKGDVGERPFGPSETALYRVAVAHWAEPMPGCIYVEARVEAVPPEGELGRYWRTEDTCHIRLAEAALSDPVLACLVVGHEVGHMFGHDHSADPRSVMYPTIGDGQLPDMPICGGAADFPPAPTTTPTWLGRLEEVEYRAGQRRRLATHCKRTHRRKCWARVRVLGRRLATEWPTVTAEAAADPALV